METKPKFTFLPNWNGNYRRLPTAIASAVIYLLMVGLLSINIVLFGSDDLVLVGAPLIIATIVFCCGHQLALCWGRTYNLGLRDTKLRVGILLAMLIPYFGFLIQLGLLLLPEDLFPMEKKHTATEEGL